MDSAKKVILRYLKQKQKEWYCDIIRYYTKWTEYSILNNLIKSKIKF